jgi:hypothetical protein
MAVRTAALDSLLAMGRWTTCSSILLASRHGNCGFLAVGVTGDRRVEHLFSLTERVLKL